MTEEPVKTQEERRRKAKEYSTIRVKLSLFSMFFSYAVMIVLLVTGLSVYFRELAAAISENYYAIVFFYFVFFYVFIWIVGLPLSIYSSFILEHKYGLSNQNFAAWLWEDVKKLVLGLIFGTIMIEGLYFFIAETSSWWLWCWFFAFLFSVVMGQLAPVFIVPLFYKYDVIKDEELTKRIIQLVENTKLKVRNVYQLNLSKTTKKANAAFMGLGNTKRVVLGDTLLSNFNHDEIECVVAHEVGHFLKKHIWKHMATSTLFSLGEFYLLFLLMSSVAGKFGSHGISDVALFPFIYVVFSVCNFLLTPIQNAYSRKMEIEADKYALDMTKKKDAFISTMDKLGNLNLSDPSPAPWVEFIFYSHPPLQKRIRFAEDYCIS